MPYRELDLMKRQPLASRLTPADILKDPQVVVREIGAASKKPQYNWEVAQDQLPVEFVSRFVQKAVQRNYRIDERRLRVVDSVARAVVNRLQFARWAEGDGVVRQVDERLGLSMLMRSVFMRAEIQAVTYMFVWPTADNRELAIVRLEPDTCIVGYPNDGHSIWPEWGARVSQPDPENKDIKQLDLYYEDRSTRWQKRTMGDNWELLYQDIPYRLAWERMVPIVPFVCEDLHNPQSGVEAALGPQLAINHALMLDAGCAEYAGFPLRWTAERTPELNTGEIDLTRGFNLDSVFSDDDDDDDDEPVIDIYPGAFIKLRADSVGEFEAAPLEATLGRVDTYGKMAFILSEVPLSYWTGMSTNNSGELMRREIQPLLGRAHRRIDLYTAAYGRVWALLRGQGQALQVRRPIPEGVEPAFNDPAWPDQKYIWELAKLQLEAGLSPEYVYEKAGLSPDEIERIMQDGGGNFGPGNNDGRSTGDGAPTGR